MLWHNVVASILFSHIVAYVVAQRLAKYFVVACCGIYCDIEQHPLVHYKLFPHRPLILKYFLQPNNPKYVEKLQILDKIFKKKNQKASQTHELALT